MKNLFCLLIASVILIASCKKNTSAPDTKGKEKKIRIEVDFGGSYQDYQLIFGIHTLTKGAGTFVTPSILSPQNMQWTQVISQGNAYNLINQLTYNRLVIESTDVVNTLGFMFNAVYTEENHTGTFQPLTATIYVFADDKKIKTYQYVGKGLGEVPDPSNYTIKSSEF